MGETTSGRAPKAPDRLDPESHQSAYPRVLQDKQPTVAELALNKLPGTLAKLVD